MIDYKKYYNLESYLLTEVKSNFKTNGFLTAEEFFCIIIWKANRSKSKIRTKLQRLFKTSDNDEAVKKLTQAVAHAKTPEEKLKYLISECCFRLPMASAILTVLYPEEFTVYDVRVCDMLKGFHDLQNKINFETIWHGYLEFKDAVIKVAPEEESLRDKDRWLWGKSFHKDLSSFLDNL